ncbi:hypothetical protein CLW00_105101 [Mongoliibacter ruber]|uniref:Uncharacterized protein n=1 Tax=Mongoliibacter ruber TaxID=1750599 RepID=A0A2T0WMQ5_9BACT|nr:hypothetical protein CLW00_105101 [Mongoliibacter ruber]
MIKAQHTTRYIKHLANSANFKAVTFNKNCSGLTGLLYEMPNVSYTKPLAPSKKTIVRVLTFLIYAIIAEKDSFAENKQYICRTNCGE